ncbi:MAG: YIP1 family protein [Bacteroidetes bacterium]|nr:YIP1 family protein [Bacteroidota bacterium]
MEQENLDSVIDNLEQQENLSDNDIFTKIWTSPRKVFKYVNDRKYSKYELILLVFAGISNGFDQAMSKNWGDNLPLWGIILTAVIGGGLLGWVSLWVYSALISWTGKWLKGEGKTDSILRIISYAMIPSIATLILLIFQIGILGNELFKANGDFASAGYAANIFIMFTGILTIILAIWTFVLCVIGVSEVQKFSIGKSILNVLLPVLVILIPIMIIVSLVKVF